MATTTTSFAIASTYKITTETATNATAVTNVTGTSGTLYSVDVTGIAASAVYVKFYDATTATVGTSIPVLTIYVPASAVALLQIPGGFAFTNGISFGCVTNNGGVTGTGNPAADIAVRILTT